MDKKRHRKPMASTTRQRGRNGEQNKTRKVFYFENNKEKPILAAGILFVKEINGKVHILVQNVQEEDGKHRYSDFGGKIDLDDKTVVQTVSREFGEGLNYGIYETHRGNNIYLDNIALKKIIQQNLLKSFYQPIAKYFVIFAKFDENLQLDMEKIGNFEKLDKINRTVEWIAAEDFIASHFNHTLHPRLWGKQILEFMGYEGNINEPVEKPKRFAFKNA